MYLWIEHYMKCTLVLVISVAGGVFFFEGIAAMNWKVTRTDESVTAK
jgi:hypothetical protein